MRRFHLPVALATAALAAPLQAQDTVTVAVGGELSAVLFDVVNVPVSVDMRAAPGERLGSYTVRITWDPAILSYQTVDAGEFGNPAVLTDSVYSDGVLWVSGVNVAGRDGVFNLFDVDLYYFASGTSPVTVEVSEMSGIEPTFTDFVATATIVNVSGTFCEAQGRWGDLDGDGFANSRDALAILSDVVQLPADVGFDVTLGDVDGDGLVNTRDALILLSYAVGIDISGQRVLLTAPGPCGTGAAPAVTIQPATADLVVGQTVKLLATANDASGAATLAARVNWQVADPNIAVVDTAGFLTVRDSGTTTVTAALGPGITATATVVGRLRRPVWHVNAPAASQAVIQMGTPEYPFETPENAFPLMSEGDTLLVAPGTHGYLALGSVLNAGVVVMGDVSGGGARPVLRARPDDFVSAFDLQGGATTEIRDLVLEGFYYGVLVNGVRTLTLDNVSILDTTASTFGTAIYAAAPVDTLRVLNSQLVGDSTFSSSFGIYMGGGATLVEIHDTDIRNWGGEGFFGYDVDSLDILRADISRNFNEGVYLYASTKPSVAARISESRFDDNRFDAIFISSARTVALDHNYIYADSAADGIYVDGTNDPLGVAAGLSFSSVGDSINFLSSGYYWMYLFDMDSVFVDSLWVGTTTDTLISQFNYLAANYAQITNSEFLNLFNDGIDFDGRELVVDNTVFQGCAVVCDWFDAWAIQASPRTDSGPAVTVSNSTFFNLEYGLYAPGFSDSAGPMFLQNNTLDSVRYGFLVDGDSLVITDNVMTRVEQRGIEDDRSGTNKPTELASILRNQITCTGTGTTYGILHYSAPAEIADNTVTNCDYGIYVSNATSNPLAAIDILRDTIDMDPAGLGIWGVYLTGRWTATISNNRIRDAGTYGMYLTPNILTGDAASVKADSNAVSGSGSAAIYISPSDSMDFVGQWNNITNNTVDGIVNVSGANFGLRSFTDGRYVGNGTWAVESSFGTFDASNSWWGSAGGPGGVNGSGLADADSVNSVNVLWDPFLTADPEGGTVPPPSPPSGDALPGPAVSADAATEPAPSLAPDRAARAEAFGARQAEKLRQVRERFAAEEQDRARRHDAFLQAVRDIEARRALRAASRPPAFD